MKPTPAILARAKDHAVEREKHIPTTNAIDDPIRQTRRTGEHRIDYEVQSQESLTVLSKLVANTSMT